MKVCGSASPSVIYLMIVPRTSMLIIFAGSIASGGGTATRPTVPWAIVVSTATATTAGIPVVSRARLTPPPDSSLTAARQSVVSGQNVSVLLDLGCRRILTKKNKEEL